MKKITLQQASKLTLLRSKSIQTGKQEFRKAIDELDLQSALVLTKKEWHGYGYKSPKPTGTLWFMAKNGYRLHTHTLASGRGWVITKTKSKPTAEALTKSHEQA